MTNELVEEVWHNLILFTKDYHIFSNEVFRQYLHHSPSTIAIPLTSESIRSFYGEYEKYLGHYIQCGTLE